MIATAMRSRHLWTVSLILLELAFLGYWSSVHLQIDRCLDLGGRWNYETSECDRLF